MLPDWFRRRSPLALDWIQVEVTSHCNGACIFCPRTVYRDAWANRHLPLDVFKRLLAGAGETHLIHLQGWGEPLLHPQFLTLVKLAKEAGFRVGTTTNGMRLDAAIARTLVEYGIEVVAFSLAGIDAKNDAVRRETPLTQALDAIGTLHEAKRSLGTARPAIHVAYMLLHSGLDDLERLPSVLRGRGIRQVVITTLDFVPCKALENETAIPATFRDYHTLRARLDAVEAEGRTHGLETHSQLHRPGERRLTCTENVQRALYVSSDGSVSPCPFANLPVSDGVDMYRPQTGGEIRYRPMTFGNLADAPLAEIWRRKRYRRFRRAFYDGGLPPLCETCPKLFIG